MNALYETIGELSGENDALCAELAALRRDKERLDKLERLGPTISYYAEEGGYMIKQFVRGETLREAIDAATAEEHE